MKSGDICIYTGCNDKFGTLVEVATVWVNFSDIIISENPQVYSSVSNIYLEVIGNVNDVDEDIKVGDKVRLLCDISFYNFKCKDKTATVTRLTNENFCPYEITLSTGRIITVKRDEIELIKEKVDISKFKVGDRVKLLKNSYPYDDVNIGSLGTVMSMLTELPLVQFDCLCYKTLCLPRDIEVIGTTKEVPEKNWIYKLDPVSAYGRRAFRITRECSQCKSKQYYELDTDKLPWKS